MRKLALFVLVTVSLFALLSQAVAANCEGWGGPWFFDYITLEEVVDCLNAGVDVNVRNRDGETPLYHAASGSDNPIIIKALVDAGAELEARNQVGRSPLHRAARWGTPAVIEALIEAGANLEAKDKYSYTPLHHAAEGHGNPEVIKVLVEAGADLEARNQGYFLSGANDATPLHLAAKENTPAVILALLDAGADPTARDSEGKTPWDYAKARPELEGSEAYWQLSERNR